MLLVFKDRHHLSCFSECAVTSVVSTSMTSAAFADRSWCRRLVIGPLLTGRAGEAETLVTQARNSFGLPPRLTAWLFAAEAEAFASAGDGIAARRCLHSAERTLPAPGDESLTPYLRLDDVNLARWRGHVLTQLRDDAAAPELLGSMSSVRGKYGRAEAGLLVDLATIALRRGDGEAGARHIREAERVSTLTGSHRQLRRLAALRTAA